VTTNDQSQSIPVVDFNDLVEYIFERMTDVNRHYGERYPEDIIEEGCLAKRLIENILYYEEDYMCDNGFVKRED
jgi:hypothetical protein